MIIRDANIRNFGKLQNRQFAFSDGLNVIYGPNESGKSTLQVFLKSMLFGLEKTRVRSRLDEYQKYQPWEAPAEFSGSLHFETGGQLFYLERSFYQKDRRDVLRNERDGEELSVAQGDLAMLLGNVSGQTYENTFCIGQNAVVTDAAAAEAVADQIEKNGTLSADDFQLSRADAYFDTEKRKLKKQLRDSESEQAYLQKIREEREDMLRSDLESIRKQQAEKEMVIRRMEREQEKYRKSGREAGHSSETGQPHRKKWNILMTLGVLIFLVSGLLGNAGSIPGAASEIICILAGVMIVVGVIQEIRKQKDRPPADEQSPHEKEKFAESEDRRQETVSASEPYMIWKERQEKLGRAKAALEVLKEQEQEKETEFYNLTGNRETEYGESGKIRDLQKELSALALAQETLHDLAQKRNGNRIRALEGEAASILSGITGLPPEEIRLDTRLQPTLQKAGKFRVPQAMSQGTADQIYFAWRMAAGKYAAAEEPLPFLLDEPFAHYDDERMERTLRWLSEQKEQIFLFTCTKRETDCLDRIGADYRKLEMS